MNVRTVDTCSHHQRTIRLCRTNFDRVLFTHFYELGIDGNCCGSASHRDQEHIVESNFGTLFGEESGEAAWCEACGNDSCRFVTAAFVIGGVAVATAVGIAASGIDYLRLTPLYRSLL
jgi:hypothetical protein